MRYKREKLTRQQKSDNRKKNISNCQKGEGLYLFKNKNNATLELPKKSTDGKRWVQPNETWQGDSYFLRMVPKEAILVKTLTPKEDTMNKLLLDQPDQVTTHGKVEHVVHNSNEKINEITEDKITTASEMLLTEDPLAGVTIIRD